ncbi:pickpocket protein 28-like [Sitodiplosis mosellana]|uniref:pickpocket protein 28-like n=1 Tax=Sitodiplosis mosellana TaxID=263140 RepID=UPI002444E473|nr:pickpocket protein 28-like [Sitodiplosis mosellana]
MKQSFIDVQPIKGKLTPLNRSAKKKIVRSVNEFCKNSSIHGIRYFVEKIHLIERIWWIVALGLSVYLCVGLIHHLWHKWRENLIIISFDHQPFPVGNIPFAAITICPMTKAISKKFNYTHVYRSMFKLDGEHSQTVTEEEYVNHLLVTGEGLCYTLNAISFNEMVTNETASAVLNLTRNNETPSSWDYENGYDVRKDVEPYPYRVFGMSTGKQASFSILMRSINQDVDFLCGGASQGFKITLHAPNERPQVFKNVFYVSPGQTALFAIDPHLMTASPILKSYSTVTRQCYFNSERKLRFFKQYTQQNCEAECLSNFTKIECGCIRFSMPRSVKEDTKICGPAKMRCLNQADNKMFQSGYFDACNCLPSCITISYDVDASQAEYDLLSSWPRSKFQQSFDFENSTFSRVTVSFKHKHFTAARRSEFRSLEDFLASSGGIFGLLMGASLLSVVELIYYFTLRIFFMKNERQVVRYRTRKNQTRIFTILP